MRYISAKRPKSYSEYGTNLEVDIVYGCPGHKLNPICLLGTW